MELSEAIDAMARILHEERQRPTIKYVDNWSDLKTTLGGQPLANLSALKLPPYNRPTLEEMRRHPPRLVSEKPQLYTFSGDNYDLLSLLFNQVQLTDRDAFVEKLMSFVSSGGFCVQVGTNHFPKCAGYVSDLPLIAEFCVRNGYTSQLFSAAATAKTPTFGLALMLMQLEETIALNFTLFSSRELRQLQAWLAPLREIADLQTHSARGPRNGRMVSNPHYKSGREREANQIVSSIDGIAKECNQAVFFYLKGALQQSRNLDVESDKIKVDGYLKTLGFDPLLQQSLDQAEKEFRDEATGFELKNCMGYLRSFLERLHTDACVAIASPNTPATEYNKWGLTVAFLKKHQFLSAQEEKLVVGIHAIMSEEGVHPLIAEREYVRLVRNVVIEYGLLFMGILEKKGVKIGASANNTAK